LAFNDDRFVFVIRPFKVYTICQYIRSRLSNIKNDQLLNSAQMFISVYP